MPKDDNELQDERLIAQLTGAPPPENATPLTPEQQSRYAAQSQEVAKNEKTFRALVLLAMGALLFWYLIYPQIEKLL